jgi:O-acetyl-ADP-ribose deacetylase (regulator of RNase III)
MEWSNELGRKITLLEGDITKVPVDAVVNAANSSLAGGGGVDGAIHRAAGPEVMQELRQYPLGCPTGGAVATGAGRLQAKYIFHAVGPIYVDGSQGEPARLASAYRTCMQLADDRNVETISFPAISTGVYGYPLKDAARIALREVKEHLAKPETKLRHAIFVLFGKTAFDTYAGLLR